MTRVSIIIPCHNSVSTLPDTLRSVVGQTFMDWEIIAINDGSTDDTRAMLDKYAAKDPRIRVVDGPGGGASAARNIGLKAAKGEIIAFLDSDDIWHKDRLARLLKFFTDSPRTDIAYSRFAFFTDTPGDNHTTSTVPAKALTVRDLLEENVVGTMSNLIVSRDILDQTGHFREDISHGEDREWLVRAAAKGFVIHGFDATLLHYRTSVGGLSTDLEKMYAGWRKSVETAGTLNALPSRGAVRSAEAVYLRYLARRAMRLGMPPRTAASYALRGVALSPASFFRDKRRGTLTLASALASVIAPRAMRAALLNR